MKFFEAVKSVFSKYATFSGRARRSEYWYFTLFNFVVSIIIGTLAGNSDGSAGSGIQSLYSLAVFVPMLAVTWRRLHDVGKSGKLAIVPMILLYTFGAFAMVSVLSGNSFSTGMTGILALLALGFYIRLLVLLVRDGQPGDNEYGPDPKGRSSFTGYSAPNYTPPTDNSASANTAGTYNGDPVREDKPYAFQRDAQPVDEIQAVVSGTGDGKVSLWGDDEEPKTPVAPSIDYDKEQSAVPSLSFCPNCGAAISGTAKFCTECGAKLK